MYYIQHAFRLQPRNNQRKSRLCTFRLRTLHTRPKKKRWQIHTAILFTTSSRRIAALPLANKLHISHICARTRTLWACARTPPTSFDVIPACVRFRSGTLSRTEMCTSVFASQSAARLSRVAFKLRNLLFALARPERERRTTPRIRRRRRMRALITTLEPSGYKVSDRLTKPTGLSAAYAHTNTHAHTRTHINARMHLRIS